MSTAEQSAAAKPMVLKRVLQSIDLFPIRRTLKTYSTAAFRSDFRAGINVALLAFPQGMAYAMIAGLPISFGLFGSAIACLIAPIFAGSRFIVLGPTNGTAVLTLSAFLAVGYGEAQMILLVPLLLLMAGVLQMAAAYLNIGSLISYISRSVIIGYITAAAVLIITNQIRNITGVVVPDSGTLIGIIEATVLRLPEVHWATVVVAAATTAVFLILKNLVPRLPIVGLTLIASVGIGIAAEKLGYSVAMLPDVAVGEWRPRMPLIDLGAVHQLASAALAIAFLGVLEGASIGKSLAAHSGTRLNTNQETFAIGAANVGCAFLGGMGASGSLTRSVLNTTSGAATPLASFYCGLVSIAFIFGLGHFVGHVPRAALAVIVVFVALSLINARQIRFVVRSTRADAVVFAVTAGSAFVVPLDSAIFLGTATSIVLFLRQAGEPELKEFAFTPEGELMAVKRDQRPLPEISIVHVEGSLFFGAAELLQEQIRRVCDEPNLKIIILRLKHAHHLDASAVLALEDLVHSMRENNRGLIVSGARKEVVRICRRTGLIDLIGRENFFPEWPQNPTLSTRNALKRAQEIIGQKEADVRVFSEMRMKGSSEQRGAGSE